MQEKEEVDTAGKGYTHEERLELAAKLDKELDDFINSLPKKKYEDGWPEDRWEEEMEKHPFFMTKPPEPGTELHPLYEGLQKLKYDPEENEPEELAMSYKEDGNYNFKYKNYRLAILSYTEGIKVQCGNADIESTLYNNRSAAHFFLGNFRSSLKDCELALKIKPNHEKVLRRAAQCCFETRKFDSALTYCDKILEMNKNDKPTLELRRNCLKNIKLQERNERKKNQENKLLKQTELSLFEELNKRGVSIEGAQKGFCLDLVNPSFPQLTGHRVHLDDNGNLIWPVIFIYPEFKIMEYIQEFNEMITFEEQLAEVFIESPTWDTEKKYNPNSVNIYFETPKKKLCVVNLSDTLGITLAQKEFVVKSGTPSFILLAKNSKAENNFLEQY